MDVLNKNMKRASVGFDQSLAVDDGTKAKIKYQALLNDYLELQKEYVSRKRKLQAAKQKKETVLGEVRFLRRRYRHLSQNQAPNIHQVLHHLPNSENRMQNFYPFLHPNSLVTNEEGEGSGAVTKKLKKSLMVDKGVGKRKIICWPEHVTNH